MKSKLLDKVRKAEQTRVKTLVHLNCTRNLKDENNITHPIFETILEMYDSSDRITQIVASIFNSIIHQERIYFALTRNGLQELVKNDFNQPNKGSGFKNTLYTTVIGELTNRLNSLNLVVTGHKMAAYGYEVIDEDLLAYLKRQNNPEIQLKEVKDYVLNYRKNDKSEVSLEVVNSINEFNKGTAEGTEKGRNLENKKERKVEKKLVEAQDCYNSSLKVINKNQLKSLDTGSNDMKPVKANIQMNSIIDNPAPHPQVPQPPSPQEILYEQLKKYRTGSFENITDIEIEEVSLILKASEYKVSNLEDYNACRDLILKRHISSYQHNKLLELLHPAPSQAPKLNKWAKMPTLK